MLRFKNSAETRSYLKHLYYGSSGSARRFRIAALIFEIAILSFFVFVSFQQQALWITIAEFAIALVLIADFSIRYWLHDAKSGYFRLPSTWMDIVVIGSLLLPLLTDSLLFLRALRAVRLFRSYQVLRDLRQQFAFFRRNGEAIDAAVNLIVFIFVMSAVVYLLEGRRHPQIQNFLDAVYFTVSTLTTTGFGDITFKDTIGRLLSIFIMIVGVALFINLARAVFRPPRIDYKCPDCGLRRHEPDAIHCKHCGRVLNIENLGETD